MVAGSDGKFYRPAGLHRDSVRYLDAHDFVSPSAFMPNFLCYPLLVIETSYAPRRATLSDELPPAATLPDGGPSRPQSLVGIAIQCCTSTAGKKYLRPLSSASALLNTAALLHSRQWLLFNSCETSVNLCSPMDLMVVADGASGLPGSVFSDLIFYQRSSPRRLTLRGFFFEVIGAVY